MRIVGWLLVLCVALADAAMGQVSGVQFFRGRGQVSASYATLLTSRNNRFFAVVSEEYFESAWDLYERTQERVQLVRSGSSWLVAVLNDGSTLEYSETEQVEQSQAERFTCTLTRVTSGAESFELLSFPWPPALEQEPDSDLQPENDGRCPTLTLSRERSDHLYVSVPPLYLSGFRHDRYLVSPATSLRIYHLSMLSEEPSTLLTSIDAAQLRTLSRGDEMEVETTFWLASSGEGLVVIHSRSKDLALLAVQGSLVSTFTVNHPSRIIGLSETGLPLVKRGDQVLTRNTDGSFSLRGPYIPREPRRAAIYTNTDTVGIFPNFDSFHSQFYILLHGETGLAADANCHLPTSFGWRIDNIIGTIGSRHAIARMKKGHVTRLAVIDTSALRRAPLTCQASLHVEVLGPSACRSRTVSAAYGERIQSAEYETLPDNLRCGFKVTLTNPNGKRATATAVQFQSSRYLSGSRRSVNYTQTTDAHGQATFWVDITRPSNPEYPDEIGPAHIVAPVGSSHWQELGVLVYDRYSHV